MEKEVKIQRYLKIYTILGGLGSDLLFFIAIKTHLFYDIKNLTSADINTMSAIGIVSILIFQLFIDKLVRKLGRKRTVQLGILMMLTSAIIFTFANGMLILCIAEVLYTNGCILQAFNDMVLANDLRKINQFDRYMKMQGESSLIYSTLTFIAAITSGYLFNISYLVPMALCILCCLIEFVLSFHIYDDQEIVQEKKKEKVKLDKRTIEIIIGYGCLYGLICISMENGLLMVNESLINHYDAATKVIYYSYLITISRAVRIVANLFLPKISLKLKRNSIIAGFVVICMSFIIFITGMKLDLGLASAILISIGYDLQLGLRDSFRHYYYKISLLYSDPEQYNTIYLNLVRSQKFIGFLMSTIASLVLTKSNFTVLMIIMFAFAFIGLIPNIKVYKTIQDR